MLAFVRRIFGLEDKTDCQTNPNVERSVLGGLDNNRTRNHYPYSSFSDFTQNSYTSFDQNQHKESRLNPPSVSKPELVSVKLGTQPETSKRILEKPVEAIIKPKIPASAFENRAVKPSSNRIADPKLFYESYSISHNPLVSEQPLHSSKLPSSRAAPPPSSPKSGLLSSSSSVDTSTPQRKSKHVWNEKSESPLRVIHEDIKSLSKRDNMSDSSSSLPSFGTPTPSPKCHPISNKPILYLASSPDKAKTKYVWVEEGTSPLYVIPEDIKGLIKRNIVPGVLEKSLSSLTYKDYFSALLYAEDYYIEKWDGFEMEEVSLKFHKAEIHSKKGKFKTMNRNDDKDDKDDKMFVAFEMESIPERRPFLLSRDFAYVRPSGTQAEPFQGIIYKVVKSNLVLVEFEEDFHEQHYSGCKYDVKFSFNRVCLKRAHQAIAAASDVLFKNFLFPAYTPSSDLVPNQRLSINCKLDRKQASAVGRIINLHGPPPYLVEGPLSVIRHEHLSRTGTVVREAVIQLYRTSSLNRILICAPTNSTCDVLMISMQKDIPESDMFRANAAFREVDEVPEDILPLCPYNEECFSCPALRELKKYRVILCTSMSAFRLHNEGLRAGHFSHIFLVDASSAIEPESLVPLANLANERTAVIITGAPNNRSGWVRSNIARQNGLMRSYFQRLRESVQPEFITLLDGYTCSNSVSFY